MYSTDIRYIDLKYAKSFGVPGYRRHALYSDHAYGLLVGDFNSRVMFGFVVYKPSPYDVCNKIRVELKRLIPSNDEHEPCLMEDIDSAIVQKFVDSLSAEEWEFKQALVVEDGCWYFKGYCNATSSSNMQHTLICTIAAKFLDKYGDAFATALLGISKVNTAADAEEVNDLLISVDAFVEEMSPGGWCTATFNRERAENMCQELRKSMKRLETEMNAMYENVQECLDVLSKYGIEEKDMELW